MTRLTFLTLSLAAAPAAAQVQFTNATETAGIRYTQLTGALTNMGDMAAMTGGAAAGDFDGDGWVDLFVTCMDQPSLLFRNLGEDVQGQHQGFQEVSSTAFLPHPPPARMNGATFADVDGDGDLDLHLTALFSDRFFLWINNGQGQFTEEGVIRGAAQISSAEHTGFSSSFGDYDGDGYLDLFVAEWGHANVGPGTPSHARLLRNRGSAAPGYFEDATDAAGVSLEDTIASGPSGSFAGVYAFTPRFSDLDDDGWPDLAIAGDFKTSRLFWNDGDGTFTDGTGTSGVGSDENGMGATIADFNGDGHLDWFVTSIFDPIDTCAVGGCNWGASGNRLYIGQGSRQFRDGTDLRVRNGGWGWGTAHLDYDNDGRLDLAMTNGIAFRGTQVEDAFNNDPTKLWRNTPQGFVDVGASVGIADRKSGKGLLTLDYDRDGDTDLFVVNAGDSPCLYRNDGGNSAHWLQVQLQGSGANRFGIGARVKLWPTAGAEPLVREMSASSNYLSQCESLLQFGLGSVSSAQRIEVRWPGGQTTVLQGVAADQRLTLVQP